MTERDADDQLSPFAQKMIDSMKQSIRLKWHEAGTTFFARAIINKDVAIACGEAGFSDAMVFFRNKAAWLKRQNTNDNSFSDILR